MKTFRTSAEEGIGERVVSVYNKSQDPIEDRIANFPKYARRQQLKRFIAMYELFKIIQPVKGSVVECGVFRGFGVMSWYKLSAMLEPENLTRRIYGFDTFEGFPKLASQDVSNETDTFIGDLYADSEQEINDLAEIFDEDRFLGHIPKLELIRGDISVTLPKFVEDHPHLIVSLLFIDCDLYEPTKAALEAIVPRMPKGSVIAFDELDNPQWPGETLAMLETVGVNNLRLQRFEWDPYISYAILD
jgi:hypothetical protein